MRSRALRWLSVVIVWVAFVGVGASLFYSERQLAARKSADRLIDLRARELKDSLADLRAAQQAYVAAGQGAQFWVPKVAQTTEAVQKASTELRQLAQSAPAQAAVDEAVETLGQFRAADTRARDYLRSAQPLMAADVIFTEGSEAAATAARQIEAARIAEHQAFDDSEVLLRKQEAYVIAAAGGLAAVVLLLLGPTGSATAAGRQADDTADERNGALGDVSRADDSLALNIRPSDAPPAAVAPPAATVPAATRMVLPGLQAAADLCTDFGRLHDLNELDPLVGRASDALNAAGIVVWLGNASGADLEPVLAHGYNAQVLARMPRVPRSADNAAAAAYRTGELQVVRSKAGATNGALVVPIVSAQGRIGALSAELRDGDETSESVQALARIVAAQLASVLSAAAEELAAAPAEPRAASL